MVKEVLGFILYMHQQIPTVLQHLEHEFHVLKEDSKQLELPHNGHADRKDKKISFLRKNNMRKMEMKLRIKMLEKLMNNISTLLSALQGAIDESPSFQEVTFVLGGSLVRPQYVYKVLFSHLRDTSGSAKDNSKSKVGSSVKKGCSSSNI